MKTIRRTYQSIIKVSKCIILKKQAPVKLQIILLGLTFFYKCEMNEGKQAHSYEDRIKGSW